VFNEVPDQYDRVRPGYPPDLFADPVAVTGIEATSRGDTTSWAPRRSVRPGDDLRSAAGLN
jgi:hypothetical protein